MNTNQTVQTVALDKLDIDPANVRKTELEPSAHMLASLATMGQIEPLIVRGNSKAGHYLVINGGKRLRALRLLAKEGKVAADHPVFVIVRDEDETAARDTSLTTAVVREELHPVDEFEAFAALKLPAAEIAKRYGMKETSVLQTLALGGLAPEIRKAWREDKIDEDTAKAFTLEHDLAEQAKLYKRMAKAGHVAPHGVKRAIVGDRGADAAMMTLVGDAYEKAGGKIERDLFGDDHIVSDPALLKKLATAALKTMCDKFVAAGWGWADAVEPYGALKSEARWSWGPFGDAQMKPHKDKGVIITFDRDGVIEVHRGAMKPEQRKKLEAAKAKKAKGGKADAEAKPEPAGLSQALVLRLSEQLTKATAEALQHVEPKLAVAALVAAFDCVEYRSPIKVQDKGMGSVDEKMGQRMKANFPANFAAASKLKEPALMKALALIAGRAVDVRRHAHGEDVEKFSRPLLDALGSTLIDQVRKQFDAEDYFNSAPKALTIKAIAEAVNPAEAKKAAKMTRAEIAKYAAIHVIKAGWLPPELRNSAYVAPKAKR